MSNPVIILVSPQMGENIGAAARAMKNFAISELRIVNPRDGWPSGKANAMAVGAVDILENAKIYDTLREAVADIEYLLATTAMNRSMNKDYILPHDLAKDYPLNVKTAIMFGRENCGLTNEEIVFANKIITIPTNKDFSSLNLAQAIMVVCYELFKHDLSESSNPQYLASKRDIEYLLEHLVNELDSKSFFKVPDKKPGMVQNIANIFTRNNLSKAEIQTLRGIIVALTK